MASPTTKLELETIRRENPVAYKSLTDRMSASDRHAEVLNAVASLYPDYRTMPVHIKMKSGAELRIGWEHAVAAMLRGDAELIVPPAVKATKRLKDALPIPVAPAEARRLVEV